MTNQYLTKIDPLEAFVGYVMDAKPYHTKIIEVLEEYIFNEYAEIVIEDSHIFGDPRCKIFPCYDYDGCSPSTQSGFWEAKDYCEFKGIEIFHPATTPLKDMCVSGYSTQPFGAPGILPVISPNQAKSFADYPAMNINSGSFYVPGDHTIDFRPGNQVILSLRIENFCETDNVLRVDIDESDPLKTKYSFVVRGDRTTLYHKGFSFFADGIAFRKKYAVTDHPSYDVMADETFVPVYPVISPKNREQIRKIGIQSDETVNSGTFTVKESTYVGGSLNQWPDRTDNTSVIMGDDPHTVVEVLEDFVDLPAIDTSCESFVCDVTLPLRPVEKVLHYSNYQTDLEFYGSPPSDSCSPQVDPECVVEEYSQTPDEGYFCMKILEATASLFDTLGQVIEGSGTFKVDGLLDASNVFVGDTFKILNSEEHIGTYTLSNITYDYTDDSTTLEVNEIVRSDVVEGDGSYPGCNPDPTYCSVGPDTCKDIVRFQIPANTIVVDGDYSGRFTQGKTFIIEGGSLAGEYTTHSSRYINGKTHIRTTITLLQEDKGFDIVEINAYSGNYYGIVIRRDLAHLFTEGDTFNIIDSRRNDGSYEVAMPGATSTGLEKLEIPVYSEIDLDLAPSGKLISFKTGYIKDKFLGYSEYDSWCNYVPYTLVRVKIEEDLRFIGAAIPISESVTLYNVENTDRQGFEVSIATVFSETPPDVVVMTDIEPAGSPQPSFWFDTSPATHSNDRLKRFVTDASPGEWVPTHTNNMVWWVKTRTNQMTGNPITEEVYYKKLYFESGTTYRETDWIMDLPNAPDRPVAPGFNLLQSARSNLRKIRSETFMALLRADESRAENVYKIQDELTEDVYVRNISVPDKHLVKVWVNNIPAYYTFTDVTMTSASPPLFDVSIEILHPFVAKDDLVYIETYERLDGAGDDPWQHNAHVYPFDHEPATVHHPVVNVFKDPSTLEKNYGAYIVGGGNFLKKFINFTEFTCHRITENDDFVRIERAKEIPILSLNRDTREMTISGEYTWLFTPGRKFNIQPSDLIYAEHTVKRSIYIAGRLETVIEVEPYPFDDVLYYTESVDIIEIDDLTNIVIVPCDRSKSLRRGDRIQIFNSSGGNDGTFTINQVTYDFALDRTDIRVDENLSNHELGGGTPWSPIVYLPVFPGEKTSSIIGALYEPTPQPMSFEDYGSPGAVSMTDVTFVIPTNPVDEGVRKISYRYDTPLHVETDYKIWDDMDIDAANNTFILKQTGYRIDWDYSTSPPTPTKKDPDYWLNHQLVPGSIFKVRFSSGYYNCEFKDADNNSYYIVKNVSVGGSPTAAYVEIEDDYEQIPPQGSFYVNDTTDFVPGIGGQIVFDGDQTPVMELMTTNKFYVDVALVSGDPKTNFVTIINFFYTPGTNETTVNVEETITDSFSGVIQIADYAFIPGIFFDSSNLAQAQLWDSGIIVWEGHHIEKNIPDDALGGSFITARTSFRESLNFSWSGSGPEFDYKLSSIDPVRNLMILAEDSDTSMVQTGDTISVYNTINNNKDFTVKSASYFGDVPFIEVDETLAYGDVEIVNVIDPNTIRVRGPMRLKLKRLDTALLDRVPYKVKSVIYKKPYSTITFYDPIPQPVIDEIQASPNTIRLWFTEKKGNVRNKSS